MGWLGMCLSEVCVAIVVVCDYFIRAGLLARGFGRGGMRWSGSVMGIRTILRMHSGVGCTYE
jgi:hypothetical protein